MSAFWFMVAAAVTVFFAFISVVVWLGARTREREAYNRSETIKKIVESGDAAAALEYRRELERGDLVRRRMTARVSGLITAAVGVALMIFLYHMSREVPGSQLIPGAAVYLVGLIPVLAGMALLVASEFMMKPDE